MNALAAAVALPVAALVLAGLLRAGVGGRLVATPTGERWHRQTTPTFGGVGIFAGFLAGAALAVAVGAVDGSGELWGIVAGAALLFVAGLVDDVRPLPPVLKLAAQFGAAAIALASGLAVEIVGNDVLAAAIGVVWLVGITNAFNLLDNMDGLAASLAAIACAYFALDAVTQNPNRVVLVLALALGCALLAFLPFNLRRRASAAVFMGDSGSQVLGFALAALALSSSWKVAGTTTATLLLPLLVLAVPILDTALVTVMRLLERRPVTQGGRDHSSHRLVYYGLSERKAVAILAAVAAAVGATGVAYNILDDARITVLGVLVTFVLLVQFASALADLEERSRRGDAPRDVPLRALFVQPRRLAEIVVDFAVVCTSFLGAYVLQLGGLGDEAQRGAFLAALPVLVGARYLLYVTFGIYRRVWRFAGVRDLAALAAATVVSGALAAIVLTLLGRLAPLPPAIFVVDALLCLFLVGASRLALRLVPPADRVPGTARRVLIVGAGRAGRSLARELAEERATRVAGFLDDNPRVLRRRVASVRVLGALGDAAGVLATTPVDEVLVTIPHARRERLDAVVDACRRAGVDCRFIRRELSPPPALRDVGARL